MLSIVVHFLLAAASAADTSRVDVERQVQAFVIDSLFVVDTTRQVVVGDSTVSGGSHFVDEDYQSALRGFGALPLGLQADFELVRGQLRVVGQLKLRRPVLFSGATAIGRLLRAEPNPRNAWSAFYRSYPGSPGYIQVSRVGLSRDGQSALVLVEYACGGLCGGTLYVLLQREAARWRIVRKMQPRIA